MTVRAGAWRAGASLRLLYAFQQEALQRRGVEFQRPDHGVQAATMSLLNSGRAELLVSYRGETPINAAMFGIFAGKAYYLYSGSSSAGRKNGGPPHLIWTMIERMKCAGVSVLNLGGGTMASTADPAAGLYRFQRDFVATVISQPAGTKVVSRTGAVLNTALRTLKTAFKSARSMLSLARSYLRTVG